MTIETFRAAGRLAAAGHSPETLIMAAIRAAKGEDKAQLREAFPRLWNEFDSRYHSPGGLLPGEGLDAPPPCTAAMRFPSGAALECGLPAGHGAMHRHGERTFWEFTSASGGAR